MTEITINNNKKIIVSSKMWKNQKRFEICVHQKKKEQWMPTGRFINIEFNKAKELLNACLEVING